MKPTPLHYFFAQDWPLKICLAVFTFGFAAGATRLVGPPWDNLAAAITVGAAIPLGLLIGFLSWAVFLTPLYRRRARINGAPFREGDTVRILSGRYRGTVAEVYAVWLERGQFRVDLGEDARKKVEDVFSPTDVLRE